MSSRIHQLPESLIARIAAGEVVERPASVLKELIENSIDAGASEISIVIEGAGRIRIQVSDNGSGMSKEEAHLSLKRHATSKISQYEDLEALHTFGFRGEALPSIAAVSHFKMVTRSEDEESGWEFSWEGGKLTSEKPTAREKGTTIEVRDLFFNTPARFKFMKADSTERAQCLRVIEEVAFHSLDIVFHVQIETGKPLVFRCHNEKTTGVSQLESDLSHGNDSASFEKNWKIVVDALKTRVAEAWGSKWEGAFSPVSAKEKFFSVWGLASHPDQNVGTTKNQMLFINHRPVVNRRLTRAIYDAYLGQLLVGRHPSWVLFLNVDPQTVDVNVHPSKREVKLAFESEIFGFLMNAVRKSLSESSGTLLSSLTSAPQSSEYTPIRQSDPRIFRESQRSNDSSSASVGTLYRPLDIPRDSGAPWMPEFAPLKNQTFRAVAQMNRMFIIAESEDGLVIVDQHAAAEKILYEKLMKNRQTGSPQIQMLLVSFSWEVALSLSPVIRQNCGALKDFGFLIEPFGGDTFVVKGYPSELGEKFDLLTLLDGLSDVLTESSEMKGGHDKNFNHKLAAMAACKGSVRAGDLLDLKACQHILDALVKLEAPQTCPHGRPTLVQMPFPELERRFKRI